MVNIRYFFLILFYSISFYNYEYHEWKTWDIYVIVCIILSHNRQDKGKIYWSSPFVTIDKRRYNCFPRLSPLTNIYNIFKYILTTSTPMYPYCNIKGVDSVGDMEWLRNPISRNGDVANPPLLSPLTIRGKFITILPNCHHWQTGALYNTSTTPTAKRLSPLTTESKGDDDDETTTTLLDTLVRPPLHVLNYLTRYSGITARLVEGVQTSLDKVRATIMVVVGRDNVVVWHW